MKRLVASLTICLAFLLTAGQAMAGGDESRGTILYSQAGKTFYGVVEKIPTERIGIWLISGKNIEVTKNTIIDERNVKVRIGTTVKVEGTVSGNIFNASKIEAKRLLD